MPKMAFNFMRWTPLLAFERQKWHSSFMKWTPARGKIGQVKIQYFIDTCNSAAVATKSNLKFNFTDAH